MKTRKSIIARDARELAAALGLTPADAVEMDPAQFGHLRVRETESCFTRPISVPKTAG